MILILDNRDSFVFNIARYFEELGEQVRVVDSHNTSLAD
ncbi:MAG: aminodeoxychorismate/anthranilate synthase component II, partial [Pseudomonadota bacterium]